MKRRIESFAHRMREAGRRIYCAAPVFSPFQRLAAAHLAGRIDTQLARLQRVGAAERSLVFLPYRDSRQAAIDAADRARKIFDIDIAALRNAAGLVAILDGLAKDTGVAMEIGFARGIDLPIGILVTDFMGEGAVADDSHWFVDPMVARFATITKWLPTTPWCSEYYHGIVMHTDDALREFVAECLGVFARRSSAHFQPSESMCCDVYLDWYGGRYEWGRREAEEIARQLGPTQSSIHVASRNALLPSMTMQDGVTHDLLSLIGCRLAAFSADGPEMDPGSAALLGLAYALNKPIVLKYSSPLCYKGIGKQMMRVNLMVECAATILSTSNADTVEAISLLLKRQ